MLSNLANVLISKGIIKSTTEIKASFNAVSLSGLPDNKLTGTFRINSIFKETSGRVLFEVYDSLSRKIMIPSEDVEMIDGMEPERLASIYNIKPNGQSKSCKIDPITGQEMRRGRKPKRFLQAA